MGTHSIMTNSFTINGITFTRIPKTLVYHAPKHGYRVILKQDPNYIEKVQQAWGK